MNVIPIKSGLYQSAQDASFADCFSSNTEYDNQSALTVYLVLVQETPGWINLLMTLRNKVVSKFGLKDLGHLAEIESDKLSSDYKVGDRVGIFTLSVNNHNEIILEDNDKHLNVKISLYLDGKANTAKVYLSTVVHVKNTLGKVYMFFVAPVHKVIVPAILNKLPPQTCIQRDSVDIDR